jgi:hypothetical protein
MSRVFTWKVLSIAVGLVLAAGVICLIAGNTDMASALFVVATLEGTVGAVVVGILRGRQRSNHPSTS